MASHQSWRRQLLGSLQGQLQLATYLAVFVGFTGASLAGLWIGQRSLIENNAAELRRSADAIQLSLRKGGLADDKLRQGLRLHSSLRTTLWLEQPNGALVLPQSDHLQISDAAIQAAMTANPERVVGQQHLIRPDDSLYLSELVERFPSGAGLWISHELGSNQQALSHYLGLMIVIWGSCLTITLLAMSALVRRIVQPLQELNAATDGITAETLASARLSVSQGPIEVIQLAGTYNALLERLSQSWGLQRQFVSAVSHELRTPLFNIKSYVETLHDLGDQLSPDEHKEFLGIANDETDRLTRLVNDVLDLSRLESGRAVQFEAMNLLPAMEQTLRTYRLNADDKQVELLLDAYTCAKIKVRIVR